MAKVTREEILKIAQMSALELHEDEIDPLIAQIEGVLTYAERVNEIASGIQASDEVQATSNVMREDEVVPSIPERVLSVAPEHEANLFVVPSILETTK